MFGLLSLNQDTINNDWECRTYHAHYCGLCKTLAHEFGPLSRIMTNYEGTLLYLFLTSMKIDSISFSKTFCPINLFRKNIVDYDESFIIADISVILFYEKIIDDEFDEKKKIPEFIKRKIYKHYMKAKDRLTFYRFDAKLIHHLMIKQRGLEEKKTHSLNLISEQTALMMSYIFGFISRFASSLDSQHNLENLGYYLGKWIYIMDSLIDFENDSVLKRFNPIAINCGFDGHQSQLTDIPIIIQSEIKKELLSILNNIENIISHINLHHNYNLIESVLINNLKYKTDIVFKTMENESVSNMMNLKVLQASVAGILFPKTVFASNGGDQLCGPVMGQFILCGIMVYAFKIMFRCNAISCCPCFHRQDTVTVDDGCGKKKIYKRGWDGSYRDQSSCC